MFDIKMPEACGLSSVHIQEYLALLEQKHLSMHAMIIVKGRDILFEHYWEPFHKDFLHRMYSVSKSFVSLAVGFLEQDGLISLDDEIGKYFPEEMAAQTDENFRRQTIRHMLMMATAKAEQYWFHAKPKDRVKFYFENDGIASRPSGTIFQYDSMGSFVLCAMVERLTGIDFLDYLREKCLDKIGFSKEATCLKCPGGHSWGDSGILCTARDLLKVARFVMDEGCHDGCQLLNRAYVHAATEKQIDNDMHGLNAYKTQGYGYQFWRTYQNSYFFAGMGCQYAICVPDKDLIFICNGYNSGKLSAEETIISGFFEHIVNHLEDQAIPDDSGNIDKLMKYASGLKLATAVGEIDSCWREKVHEVYYKVADNPMGITRFKLFFDDRKCLFYYTNQQGDKCIECGMGENVFGVFPQEGYAGLVGTKKTEGHYYQCAASAAWIEPSKLFIKVQIIDNYFGNLDIVIGFKEGCAGLYMSKAAEDFLDEYEGYASAIQIRFE